MQNTSTHITKLCVKSTPIGLDANISPIIAYIVDTWKETTAGVWAEKHAHKIYARIDDYHEELGALVKVMADFDHSDAVAYKLMFGCK